MLMDIFLKQKLITRVLLKWVMGTNQDRPARKATKGSLRRLGLIYFVQL